METAFVISRDFAQKKQHLPFVTRMQNFQPCLHHLTCHRAFNLLKPNSLTISMALTKLKTFSAFTRLFSLRLVVEIEITITIPAIRTFSPPPSHSVLLGKQDRISWIFCTLSVVLYAFPFFSLFLFLFLYLFIFLFFSSFFSSLISSLFSSLFSSIFSSLFSSLSLYLFLSLFLSLFLFLFLSLLLFLFLLTHLAHPVGDCLTKAMIELCHTSPNRWISGMYDHLNNIAINNRTLPIRVVWVVLIDRKRHPELISGIFDTRNVVSKLHSKTHLFPASPVS